MKKSITKIKEWIILGKVWAIKNPKLIFKYGMILLIISYVGSILQHYYFPVKSNSIVFPIPYYMKDDITRKVGKNGQKIESIVEELKAYKEKYELKGLSKTDSLRVDYLYNQYQKLKNGN